MKTDADDYRRCSGDNYGDETPGDAWEGGKSAAVDLKLPTDQTAGGSLGVKNDVEDEDADTDGIPISQSGPTRSGAPKPKQNPEPRTGNVTSVDVERNRNGGLHF